MEKHYKTCFVLDASAVFRSTLCGEEFQIDIRNRSRPNFQQFPAISKPLYTCAVEAIYEYCRIVWDVFPEQTNLGMLTATDSSIFPSAEALQLGQISMNNYEELVKTVSEINDILKCKADKSPGTFQHLEEGFKEALKRITTLQNSKSVSLNENIRIIIITHISEESLVESFAKNFKKFFGNFSKDYEKHSSKSISQLDVILLNTFPTHSKYSFKHQEKARNFNNPDYQFTHLPIKSGQNVISKIISLALEHYDLVSTTVMNIPMKEEQNAGSSTHYDVEMIHSKSAHFDFLNDSRNHSNQLEEKKRDDQTYKTLKLVWGLNRGNFQYEVLKAYRIAALDLHMRPTICFINFFNSGKPVMLETNDRRKTHLLQIHRGAIYIHVLKPHEKTMFDLPVPAVVQSVGEEVPDYLVDEFSAFIQQNQLAKNEDPSRTVPQESLQSILEKRTGYFPMVSRLSVVFSLPDRMNDFFVSLGKPELSDDDLTALKNFTLQLVCSEGNFPIFTQLIDAGKLKRQEHFEIFCDELERVLRRHSVSKKHEEFLEYFINLKSQFNIKSSSENIVDFPMDVDIENGPIAKRRLDYSSVKLSNKSLLQLCMEDFHRSQTPREEFVGRKRGANGPGNLYVEPKKPPQPE